jgi:hypothetical protein
MASNTTLVHVHVETALKVSSFIAKQLANGEAFETEAKAAINTQNTSALIKLILSNQDAIYAMENDSGKWLRNVPFHTSPNCVLTVHHIIYFLCRYRGLVPGCLLCHLHSERRHQGHSQHHQFYIESHFGKQGK